MEVFYDRFDFTVGEQRIIGGQLQAPVQQWMVIEDAWFGAGMFVRAAVPTRVRQLQTHYQPIVGAGCQNMLVPQNGSQTRKALLHSRGS